MNENKLLNNLYNERKELYDYVNKQQNIINIKLKKIKQLTIEIQKNCKHSFIKNDVFSEHTEYECMYCRIDIREYNNSIH